ncbi:MAG: polysaccharide biosynthesis protein [Lachnospiraceae bacterium]
MKLKSLRIHPLLTGTLLLTITGLLSRIIGFFYRIFLSHTIGAEGVGIYQLIFPIYALTFSFTVSGIQTSISRFVAQAVASLDSNSYSKKKLCNARCYLTGGLMISLSLSFLCSILLFYFADNIALYFLEELRCASLLRILSFTVPFGAVHACINGYFYGLKKSFVPAMSQLFEQLVRVGCVWVIYQISIEQQQPVTVDMAVWGLVAGEIASVLFSISFLGRKKSLGNRLIGLGQLFMMSAPLCANRVLVNLLQSVEAVMIPGQLREYGYSILESLSVYGVLTGMALPMVLFPSVITNSVSVMLLPVIAEAQEKEDIHYIRRAVKKTCSYCLLLGFLCTLGFLFLGHWMGEILFANELAGSFIVTLCWMCPFLYLSTTLSSILNGLGKTSITFTLNVIALAIRIAFVVWGIPLFGIKAYLWGMLVSQIVMGMSSLGILVNRLH